MIRNCIVVLKSSLGCLLQCIGFEAGMFEAEIEYF